MPRSLPVLPYIQWIRPVAIGAAVLAVAAAFVAVLVFVPAVRIRLFGDGRVNADEAVAEKDATFEPAQLVPNRPNTLRLAPETARLLGVQTDVAKVAPQSDSLRLTGSLFLDANHRMNIHTPFTGQVETIGKIAANGAVIEPRTLRVGDRVAKDELLAVVWSKEIGEKKSDLVDALSKRYLDEGKLKRLKSLVTGVV